jgi:hypothetical protein
MQIRIPSRTKSNEAGDSKEFNAAILLADPEMVKTRDGRGGRVHFEWLEK